MSTSSSETMAVEARDDIAGVTTDDRAGSDSAEMMLAFAGPNGAFDAQIRRRDRRSAMDDYHRACARYTTAVRAAEQSQTRAEVRYRDEVAAVRDEAQQVVDARDAAVRRASDTSRLIADVDKACFDIWRKLGNCVGSKRLGAVPEPCGGEHLTTVAQLHKHMVSTRDTVTGASRGDLPFPLPRITTLFAVMSGVISALLATWCAELLVGTSVTGENAQALVQAAALAVVFLGFFAGIPVFAGWLSVWHGVKPAPIHVAACVAGSLATLLILVPLFLVE